VHHDGPASDEITGIFPDSITLSQSHCTQTTELMLGSSWAQVGLQYTAESASGLDIAYLDLVGCATGCFTVIGQLFERIWT